MSNERKNTEVYVGLFLLIGFTFIAGMVVTFGKVGQSFQKKYEIVVEFPNASGLVKDSDVLLAGARIGYVSEIPKLVGHSYTVQVALSIRDDVKIPRKSDFVIGSSGLMGDRYVDVIPQANFDPGDVAQPNELIKGSRASNMDDLMVKGGLAMDDIRREMAEIDKIRKTIDEGLLSKTNIANIEETFKKLKEASTNFSDSSQKLEPIFISAKEVVDSAKTTMKTVDSAAGDLRLAIADIRKTAESATKTMDSAKGLVDSGRTLVKKISDGNGPLGTLISDPESAGNLKAFLSNLRRSGPLFYKDRPVPVVAPAVRR